MSNKIDLSVKTPEPKVEAPTLGVNNPNIKSSPDNKPPRQQPPEKEK